jgi:PHD/YefM family antitoxin component YafN of YafNO toxin-antitoxin module
MFKVCDSLRMVKLEEIHSLTDFQRDAKTHIKRLKKTGRPEVLTVNGRASVVVQDAFAYQEMLDVVERAETVAGISRGLESMKRGEGELAGNVFERLRKRHRIGR